jgi:hypothetical protein
MRGTDVGKTMKVAVVHEFVKPLVIEDVPVPVPGRGELLVKAMACRGCHKDLHAADSDARSHRRRLLFLDTRWPASSPQWVPTCRILGKVIRLVSLGCMMPACGANFARPVRKHCVSNSAIRVIAATAVLPNM